LKKPAAAPFQISLLGPSHIIEGFDCGDPARNAWLQNRAVSSQASDDSRAYVAAGADSRVIGFHAIATGAIIRAMLPGAIRRNAPDPVSCVLLAQLGVAVSHQGQGISITLVLHAMRQAARVAEIAGCRLLVVHPATPELAGYYRKFGFIDVETTPMPIMAMNMGKVRATPAAFPEAGK
jgi:predicted N-acetyltransferase YhbS